MLKIFTGKIVEPHRPNVLDIETAPNGDVIGVGFAYEYQGEIIYKSYEDFELFIEEYINFLYTLDEKELKRYSRLYAHNGANFDYLSLYKYLLENDLLEEAKYIMADSAGIGAQFTIRGCAITLFDSYRLLPASLSALSKTFNVENKKLEHEYNDFLLFKKEQPELFWSYLRNDVLGLQEIIYLFWQRIYEVFGNIGELPMTLPALALRVFSKQMPGNLLIPTKPELKELERIAYKGGLTLCLRTGIFENVNIYDVNSMYPAQMAQQIFPVSYKGYWTTKYKKESIGIWYASFVQTARNMPPFLFDNEKGAAYEGKGAFTTQELNYLLEVGGKFEIEKGYVYTDVGTPFKTFITQCYTMRKEAQKNGDDALAFTLKIFMNSLYGKFAQREEGNSVVLASPEAHKELIKNKIPFTPLGDFMAIPEHRNVRHLFVGLAAYVTAYARIDLHKRMREMILAGYDVLYCDTDSIHVVEGTMLESNELGAVKREFSGRAAYAGKKIYALQDADKHEKTRAKGIGRKLIKNTTPHTRNKKPIRRGAALTFEEVARLATNKSELTAFTFETFPSVKEVMRGTRKAAVIGPKTRVLRNTGGIWDNDEV